MAEYSGKRVTDKRLRKIKNLSSLESLSLLNTSVTDEGIALLSEGTNLREINIRSDLLTDACMETLCTLPKLVSLLIHDAPFITDLGIVELEKRESLRELYLDGTHLTDRGVHSIAHLDSIWSLGLRRTLVTDTGIAQLAPLSRLKLLMLEETAVVGYGLCELPTPPRSVYLTGCPVTDDAVSTIASHLPDLRRLSLMDTKVTDDCLPALAGLKKLESLRLTGTPVTDAGVAHFRAHPSLTTLEVRGTGVTEEEKLRLKELSPHRMMTVIL